MPDENERLRAVLIEVWDYIHGPKKRPGYHNCDRDTVCRIEPCPTIRAALARESEAS